MIVISDTSPVANLIVIGKLGILKEVFEEIVIPPAVDSEIEKLSGFSISLDDSCRIRSAITWEVVFPVVSLSDLFRWLA